MDDYTEKKSLKDVNNVQMKVGHRNTDRRTWTRQLDFVLSLVGYSIGLGNIWRFPYVCIRNGGGAFLIPYFFFLLICGLPLFFLELAIGQFSSLSAMTVWKLAPLFRGIGWAMVAVSGIVGVYYNIILAWTLFYLGNSFTGRLPWSNCLNDWNTPLCFDGVNVNVTGSEENLTLSSISNLSSETINTTEVLQRTAGEEFWLFEVLQLSSGIHEIGGIRWQLALCLLAAWVIIFLCICRGVRSSGKVVYVSATIPYIFLTAILIRGSLLPGASKGIEFYIKPDFKQLLKFQTWGDACLQIFYSLGPCWGGLITMASYNRFSNNCLRDAVLVCLTCGGTSLFAGFVIFSIIGFMAEEVGRPVQEVITSGPGLAFIAYPEALSRLPVSPVWAICFFLMLLTIGLDTQFGMVETLVSGFVDEFPQQLSKYKTRFAAAVCFVAFCLGLIMVTNAGVYIFQIIDWYSASCSPIVIGLMECLVISWIYGLDRFYRDIEMMLGHRPSVAWKVFWAFITPLVLAIIFVYNLAMMKPPTHNSYRYPVWAQGIGWIIALASVVPIPLCMAVAILKEKGPLLERLRCLLSPSADWGPGHFAQSSQYHGEFQEGNRWNNQEEVLMMKKS